MDKITGLYTIVTDGIPAVVKNAVELQDILDVEDVKTLTLDELKALNVYPVHPPESFTSDGYDYELSLPFLDAETQLYKTTWVKKVSQDQYEARLFIKSREARNSRDFLIAQTDWTQMKDVVLSAEKEQEWKEYRQALRDITSQEGFPFNVVWPTAPQK